ncbi:hypothetical protein DFJ73DRAFT_533852 [Zopfochytrium polystomum]|nr:hypothetical protein DFJ73DRAFT_533852 [Zopfochytrium polystomum]
MEWQRPPRPLPQTAASNLSLAHFGVPLTGIDLNERSRSAGQYSSAPSAISSSAAAFQAKTVHSSVLDESFVASKASRSQPTSPSFYNFSHRHSNHSLLHNTLTVPSMTSRQTSRSALSPRHHHFNTHHSAGGSGSGGVVPSNSISGVIPSPVAEAIVYGVRNDPMSGIHKSSAQPLTLSAPHIYAQKLMQQQQQLLVQQMAASQQQQLQLKYQQQQQQQQQRILLQQQQQELVRQQQLLAARVAMARQQAQIQQQRLLQSVVSAAAASPFQQQQHQQYQQQELLRLQQPALVSQTTLTAINPHPTQLPAVASNAVSSQ